MSFSAFALLMQMANIFTADCKRVDVGLVDQAITLAIADEDNSTQGNMTGLLDQTLLKTTSANNATSHSQGSNGTTEKQFKAVQGTSLRDNGADDKSCCCYETETECPPGDFILCGSSAVSSVAYYCCRRRGLAVSRACTGNLLGALFQSQQRRKYTIPVAEATRYYFSSNRKDTLGYDPVTCAIECGSAQAQRRDNRGNVPTIKWKRKHAPTEKGILQQCWHPPLPVNNSGWGHWEEQGPMQPKWDKTCY